MAQEAFMAAHAHLREFIGVTPTSDFHLAEIVEGGLPLSTLTLLRERGLSAAEVGELVISPRTLKHRRARKEGLSAEEADRAVRVARVVGLAGEVFGNAEKALLWLRSPDERLGERTPLNLLQTESGGRLVEGMLWQLDEGIYT
jgi:putative toxin-antitoxin system antitoxin component (TIGR02293 family)